MQLEKIVTDWYTIYCQPETIASMKNCIIYISEYNVELLKRKINEVLNDNSIPKVIKEIDWVQYTPIISFIKRNLNKLNNNAVQTEELVFMEENNSYIVVVKDVKDIRTMNETMNDIAITRADNETIFIALFEEAQIITVRDSIAKIINENSIPVFHLNIRIKD